MWAAFDSLTQKATPHVVALFRIVVAFLFACHGASSIFGVLGGSMGTGRTVLTASWPGWYAAVIQLTGGILVLIGLRSRAAAFVNSGSMAYAYFSVHQGTSLWPLQNGGEASVMFCWAFALIVFIGPGSWALDHALLGKSELKKSAQRSQIFRRSSKISGI
ncbi:DoxX family protein [Streptomyces noursei ATCC 11455]|uniref:DoxX family protein n=1 Tax=Streptomyces noursei TaxID=1971 RepID=UPI00081C9DC9|nr:DoxX family protein [Streptomyces noursei ATCC 11455]